MIAFTPPARFAFSSFPLPSSDVISSLAQQIGRRRFPATSILPAFVFPLFHGLHVLPTFPPLPAARQFYFERYVLSPFSSFSIKGTVEESSPLMSNGHFPPRTEGRGLGG